MLFHVHVSLLYRYWDTRHYYCMFMDQWYTDTLLQRIPLHGYSVHSYFMFLHHYYVDLPVYMHWLHLYFCCMEHFLYYCYMDNPVFPLHDCFPLLILIFLLLDMWTVDMRCVKLSVTWIQATGSPLEFHISCFPFSIILFHAINRAHVLLSCYMYHALFLFLIYV